MHGGAARGTFDVAIAAGFLDRLIARAMGFPRAESNVPVTLIVSMNGATQEWRRTIGTRAFHTTQFTRAQRSFERVGMMRFAFALDVEKGQPRYRQQQVVFAGIPLPRAFAPTVRAVASADTDTSWVVQVEISVPALGLIARYGGRMELA